jgi:hypothetical protein
VPFSDEDYRKFVFLLMKDLGVPYDYHGIWHALIKRQKAGRTDKLFCSEQVTERSLDMDRALFNAPSWQIYPGHLAWSRELEWINRVVTD